MTIIMQGLLSGYLQTYMKSAFPVINNQNQLSSVVTLNRAMEIPDYKDRTSPQKM